MPNRFDRATLLLRRNRDAYRSRIGARTGSGGVNAVHLGKRKSSQLNLHPIRRTLKLPQRSAANQAALVKEGNTVADMFHLGQLVRAEENALARVARIAQ